MIVAPQTFKIMFLWAPGADADELRHCVDGPPVDVSLTKVRCKGKVHCRLPASAALKASECTVSRISNAVQKD
jgi:hypothetical protein